MEKVVGGIKMEVYFKRNLLQSYMVIEDSFYGGYDMTMLNRNRLPGFFTVKMVEADGTWQYWYEITGLQMLDEYMKQKPVDYALLKKIVLQIDACLRLAAEYLLLQENISMQAERIGVRPETGQLYFCYHRGENVEPERQFQNLIEQILPNVDHKDRQAVEAIYAIYEIVLADHFDFSDVKKVFAEIPELTEDTVSMVAEDIEYRQEEPEEKTEENKAQKEWGKLRGALAKLKEPFYRNKKESRPILVSFEPDDEEVEEAMHPTVLLSDISGVIGKLNYNGRNGEADFLIQSENFKIGTREDEVDACLKSAAVSRIHARIVREGEEYLIEDLNSKNGTWVNGELLNYKERRKLKKNDRIRFADEEYIFS